MQYSVYSFTLFFLDLQATCQVVITGEIVVINSMQLNDDYKGNNKNNNNSNKHWFYFPYKVSANDARDFGRLLAGVGHCQY